VLSRLFWPNSHILLALQVALSEPAAVERPDSLRALVAFRMLTGSYHLVVATLVLSYSVEEIERGSKQ
jgi:hypothetical protein